MTDKWRIEGDYFEACNCDTVCSCIFMGNPDQGQCDLTGAWHIQNGHFEDTKLDNLNVAAVFHTPGNMWTGPKWKAALYVDERASKEQAEALGKIYSGQAGGFFSIVAGLIGEIAGVHSLSIKFEAEGKKRSLEIPSAIDLTIEGITGGDQKSESVITNPPMSVTPGFPMVIAKSVKYTYNDHGMKWDNSGKNGFYSKFTYTAQQQTFSNNIFDHDGKKKKGNSGDDIVEQASENHTLVIDLYFNSNCRFRFFFMCGCLAFFAM